MISKYISLIVTFCLGIGAALATIPPNWVVNPSDYLYDMSLTAQVEVNCEQNLNPNNTLAAFVNGECRGIAQTSVSSNSGVLNMVLMSIHSHNNTGDEITFKYYDQASGIVTNLSQVVTFNADSVLGTSGVPFQILGTYHPTSIEIDNHTIYDTTNVNDIVGVVNVIDPDVTDVYSLEIVETLDYNHFHLNGNELLVSEIPNVISDSLYKVVVKGTFNSTCIITDTLEINLVNTYVEPVFMAITNDTVFDYSEIGDTVGEFSLVNVPENGVEYTLIDTLGTDYGYFVMVDNYLVLNHEIDILTETTYNVFVRAHGGTDHYVDSILVVTINNTNTPPTAMHISNDTVFDYSIEGELIGVLSVDDANENVSYEFSFDPTGTHQNDYFILVDNELYLNHDIDILTETDYQVHLKAYDGVAYSIDTVFTITLNNTNDEPTAILLSNDTVFDYSESGDLIGMFTTVDLDTNAVYTYSFDASGIHNNDYFILTGSELHLNHSINILTETEYKVHIKAFDGVAYSIDSIFTITLNNTNVEPSEMIISNDTVFDYSESGDLIGEIYVLDENEDADYTLSFDETGTHNNDYFILTGNELYLNHNINILTEAEYKVHLKGYDGVAYYIDSVFTITINNTNIEPSEMTISNDTVFDYSENGDLIGSLNVLDENEDAVYTLSFDPTGSHNNDYFILTGNELYLNHDIDILTETDYQVHIKGYDGVAYYIDSIFTITINNTNIEPSEMTISNDTIFDYSENGELIGSLSVLDENEDAVYTLSFDPSGNHNNDYFILTGNALYLNHDINILTETEYKVHIKGYDGVAYYIDSMFTITINNTNIIPTEITISNDTVYDYSPNGELIGMLNVIDENADEVYTLSFDNSGNHNNDHFILTGNQLYLNHDINILTETEYLVHIKGYDGVAYSIDSIFTIKLNNTNYQPSAIVLNTNVVYDYSVAGDSVGTIQVLDENEDASYTLSDLDMSKLDNSKFNLLGTKLMLNHQVDASIESVYRVEITAYDGVAYWITDTVSIVVNNTNIYPYSLDLSSVTVYDYSVVGDTVATLSVQDANIGETYTYSMTANPSFFLLNNHLVLNQNINVLNDTAFDVIISAYDGSTWTIDSTYTITVSNTNAEPTEITVSNSTIYDYTNSASLVGTFGVTDANGNIPYTYSLENSLNSSMFQIVDNKLFFMGIIDPQVGQYQIEVSAYDGVLWTIDSVFTIEVTNTNIEPTAIHISNDSIFDYTTPGDVVGYFNVDDINGGTTYTYSLGTSLNENLFTIIGNTLKCYASINPQAGEYQIQVSAYDGSQWTIDSVMTIIVHNTNTIPTALNLSNTTITDQTVAGDVVGSLSVTDANANESYSYSITAGVHDGNLFQIVGNDLQFIGTVDPQIGTYAVEVSAFDGVLWTIDSVFTITVNNTNIQPTAVHISNNVIYDYTLLGDVVGHFNVDDVNAGTNYSYSLGTSLDEDLFIIIGNTLKCNGTIDPQAGEYQIKVSAFDGSQWTIDSVMTIVVNNTNELPTAINLSNTVITDQTTSGTTVGLLTVTDANSAEMYSYTISTGIQDGDLFQIVGNDLQFIGIVDPQIGAYQVQIEAYDGSQWTIDSLLTITVNNTNAIPTVLNLSNTEITDQTTSGAIVGNLSVTDVNTTEIYVYSITAGIQDGNLFQIVGNDLQFIGTVDPQIGTYKVQVEAYDGSQWTIDSLFTITVNNTNEKPTSFNISNAEITDQTINGTEIGTLSVTDANSEVYTYSIKTGYNADNFQVVNNSLQFVGVVDVSKPNYKVELEAYDGKLWTIDSVFTISVNNMNAVPTALNLSNTEIKDYDQIGKELGTLSVTDVDVETYSYTLSSTLDGNKFSLVGDKIILLEDFDPSETVYHILVSAYDGRQHSIDSTFTINLNNTNPAPVSLTISNNEIEENSPIGTLAGELTVGDNGTNEIHTFELSFTQGDNDNFDFEVIGNKVYSKVVFDYEEKSTYEIEVTVTDVVNNTFTELLTINVSDVLEVDVLKNNNYLTPNGDGVNDTWELENVELYEDFSLTIYNKQGQKVYQTEGYDNTWSGSDLPIGTYIYYLKSNTTSVSFSGNIHLLK